MTTDDHGITSRTAGDPSEMQTGSDNQHKLVLEVPPGLGGELATLKEWVPSTATVATWPDPGGIAVERRIFRSTRNGQPRQVIIAGLNDPFGLHTRKSALEELEAVLSPFANNGYMRRANRSLTRMIAEPKVGYAAELARLDPVGQHSRDPMQLLFGLLVSRLVNRKQSFGMSMLLTPVPLAERDEIGQSASAPRSFTRPVRFGFRIWTEGPLPIAILTQIEAMALNGESDEGDWVIARRPAELASARAAVASMKPIGAEHGEPTSVFAAGIAMSLADPIEPASGAIFGRPPSELPSEGVVLGRVTTRNGGMTDYRLPFGRRKTHVFIAAASGVGKSVLIERMVRHDIERGRPVILIESHGDQAANIAEYAPKELLCHFDPGHPDTMALDILGRNPEEAGLNIAAALSEIYDPSWHGPRFHEACRIATDCLFDALGHVTPVLIHSFFVDPDFRQDVIEDVSKGSLREEATREHRAWLQPASDDNRIAPWIASKLQLFATGPAASLFDRPPEKTFEEQIAAGCVTVICLPIGVLGSAHTSLLIRMVLTRITKAITSQGSLPPDQRREVSVFIDEAQHASGPALEGLYSQSRKFSCSITCAAQHPGQLSEHLDGVLTNSDTHIFGRLAEREARRLEFRVGELGSKLLTRLPNHHFILAASDDDPDLPPVVLSPAPLLPPPEQGGRGDHRAIPSVARPEATKLDGVRVTPAIDLDRDEGSGSTGSAKEGD